jgi:Tfp pilus assembly protein PilX
MGIVDMTNTKFTSTPSRTRSRGISLVIVLIMLVIIGVTAATAMRSATSEQKATNNLRMEGTAQQYAEAALRYCEAQLQLADGGRVATLKTAVIPTTTFALSGWEDPATWTGGAGRASASRTPVPAGQISDANTVVPPTLPECVAEVQTVGSPTFTITVVTARGFSPDYARDGAGNTTNGAVVWLQSIINAN